MPGRRTLLPALALALILAMVGHLAGRRSDEQSTQLAYLVQRRGETLEANQVTGAERSAADLQLAAAVSSRIAAGVSADPPLHEHFTGLYAAVRYELPVTARTLMDAGADIKRCSFGSASPLWAAGMNKDAQMITLLKAAGAEK